MQRGYGICHAGWALERWLLSDWDLVVLSPYDYLRFCNKYPGMAPGKAASSSGLVQQYFLCGECAVYSMCGGPLEKTLLAYQELWRAPAYASGRHTLLCLRRALLCLQCTRSMRVSTALQLRNHKISAGYSVLTSHAARHATYNRQGMLNAPLLT